MSLRTATPLALAAMFLALAAPAPAAATEEGGTTIAPSPDESEAGAVSSVPPGGRLSGTLSVPPGGNPGALPGARGLSDEEATPLGLPSIGFWMMRQGGDIADWLGVPFDGKRLLEPINVVIVDRFASSADEASARLLAACGKAEFPKRQGHSSGYSARLGAQRFEQFPPGSDDSFSDAVFVFSNDHGRLFGPFEWAGGYIFVGAFSREGVDLVTKVKHRYQSFNRARDTFARMMSERGCYEVSGYLNLGNFVVGSPELSTGDHDGVAVLLSARQ